MTKMDKLQKDLMAKVAGLHDIPSGAVNIRVDGEAAVRNSTDTVRISPKTDKPGIDIAIRNGTVNEAVHIPVIISQAGLTEIVYNDFFIGEDCDVTIVAGCGIHNDGDDDSQHDGIHKFFVGKNSRVRYVETHYGSGEGEGGRILNPQTIVELEENAVIEMETVQIKGVDSTVRWTKADLAAGAKLIISERLMTHGKQYAKSEFEINMNGDGAASTVSSRSVAKDKSSQLFASRVVGNAECTGHSECDAIIMGNAKVDAVPEILANHPEASLIHEAAIGKIAGEQLIKLRTLGLSEEEAEEQIIGGFLA